MNKHWILLVVLVAPGIFDAVVRVSGKLVARMIHDHEFNRRDAVPLAAGKSAMAVSCGMGGQ